GRQEALPEAEQRRAGFGCGRIAEREREVVLLGGGQVGGEASAEQQRAGALGADGRGAGGRLFAPPALDDLARRVVVAVRDPLFRAVQRRRLRGARKPGRGEREGEQERGGAGHRAAGTAARASSRSSSSSMTCRSESGVDLSSRS